MKKEKLHIVIVENLEYWLTNETSDWRVKEYIVRAPNRETAVKLTKEHLTIKEKPISIAKMSGGMICLS